MVEFLQGLNPTVLALIRVLIVVVAILTLVPGLIWWERRLLSWMQDRIGPNRVATFTLKSGKKIRLFGLLQPIADGVKLFFKEDVTPAFVDRTIYFLAPAVALFPAFAIGGTLPWGPSEGLWGLLTPIADVDIGILYVMAISSLGVYGVVLAGFASNNKYSLLGGLRSAAQLISYELAMGVSLACIVMATGSLRMTDMVTEQMKPLWGSVPAIQNWFIFTPFGLVSFVIFLICMVAETNRAPFDLPEAENEIIAGYHTEYSSMKFAVFFMGEYAAMFLFGGVLATVFFGGYNMLPVNWDYIGQSVPAFAGVAAFLSKANYWLAPITFIAKQAFVISFYIWLRATLPRLRYDQLMSLGWKSLLPLAVANFIVVAIWIMGTSLYGVGGGFAAAGVAIAICIALYFAFLAANRKGFQSLQKRDVEMTDGTPTPKRSVELVDPAEAGA